MIHPDQTGKKNNAFLPGVKKKKSIASKRVWENPLHRKRMSEIRSKYRHNDESKKKISISSTKNWKNPKLGALMLKNIKKVSEAKKGSKLTEEHKRKISIGTRETLNRPEIRKKLGHKGDKNVSKRPDVKRKQSTARTKWHKTHPEFIKGENNPNFNNWSSLEPYGPEFNEKLKEIIRNQWGRICILCGQLEDGRKLDVHHIDYDKKHNNSTNLIPLHYNCHILTNFNRKFWIEYFKGATTYN